MSSGPNSSLPQVTAGVAQAACSEAVVPMGTSMEVPPWQGMFAAAAISAMARVARGRRTWWS